MCSEVGSSPVPVPVFALNFGLKYRKGSLRVRTTEDPYILIFWRVFTCFSFSCTFLVLLMKTDILKLLLLNTTDS